MTEPTTTRRGGPQRLSAWLLTTSIVLGIAAPGAGDSHAPDPGPIGAAVASTDRPPADRARDDDRRPAEVLGFFEVAPGQRTADLMTGGGYYAELLSRSVGPKGLVIAQNNAFVVERFADKPLRERLARPGLENIRRVDSELEAPELPTNLDLAMMVLFYHDTYWQEVDREKMNRAIFQALRPGGIYGVIDHRAEAGSGSRDVKTVHRVDAEIVKREIEAAGFIFEAESDVLHHPEDPRTQNVFDKAIRGKTDRFVYRFRKPMESKGSE